MNHNQGESYKTIDHHDNKKILVLKPKFGKFEQGYTEPLVLDNEQSHETDKREYIVKNFISELLKEIGQNTLTVDPANEPIISFWREYASDFLVDGNKHKSIADHPLTRLLSVKRQLFRDIIAENCKKSSLLIDGSLSPEGLSMEQDGVKILLEQMIREIRSGDKKAGNIAVIQSGQALIVDYLTSNLSNIGHITLFDQSLGMLNLSREQYGENGISYEYYDNQFLDGDHIGDYDHILVINMVHQFESPEYAVAGFQMMLKHGGKLHMIDFSKMDSMSVLIAIFFQEKYLHIHNEKRDMFFYRAEYMRDLVGTYFGNKKMVSFKNSDEYYITAENTMDGKGIVNNVRERFDLVMDQVVIVTGDTESEDGDSYTQALQQYISRRQERSKKQKPPAQDNESDIRETLKTIWKENLNITQLEDDDHYFKLGGDSLSATRLVVAVNHKFHCKISLTEIFVHPTIREMRDSIHEKVLYSEIIEGEI